MGWGGLGGGVSFNFTSLEIFYQQKRRVTFIDKIRVYVKGGTGGMGCPSAGGCGSKGGDVYVECAEGASLARYSTLGNRRHVAGHGTHFRYV